MKTPLLILAICLFQSPSFGQEIEITSEATAIDAATQTTITSPTADGEVATSADLADGYTMRFKDGQLIVEKDADDSKYQLTITIKYNSVSAEKTAALTSQFLKQNSSACKVEVNIKKLDGGNLPWDFTGHQYDYSTGTWR